MKGLFYGFSDPNRGRPVQSHLRPHASVQITENVRSQRLFVEKVNLEAPLVCRIYQQIGVYPAHVDIPHLLVSQGPLEIDTEKVKKVMKKSRKKAVINVFINFFDHPEKRNSQGTRGRVQDGIQRRLKITWIKYKLFYTCVKLNPVLLPVLRSLSGNP